MAKEKWLLLRFCHYVVAKVKFVLIAPPGWKFQFSLRFVKLFIRRFNEVSQRDITTENSSLDHDLLDESFPFENGLLTRMKEGRKDATLRSTFSDPAGKKRSSICHAGYKVVK